MMTSARRVRRSLGAMYACQIYDAAKRDLPVDEDVAKGSFGGLKTWLNEKVHSAGSLYPSGDLLMEQVSALLARRRAREQPRRG